MLFPEKGNLTYQRERIKSNHALTGAYICLIGVLPAANSLISGEWRVLIEQDATWGLAVATNQEEKMMLTRSNAKAFNSICPSATCEEKCLR